MSAIQKLTLGLACALGCARVPATLTEPAQPTHDASPPNHPSATKPVDAGRLEGWVAVRPDAMLYSRPDTEAKLGRLGQRHTTRSGDLVAHVWRVVADQGEFVALESIDGEARDRQCMNASTRAFRDYSLRAFVRRESLMLVTRREVELEFIDGSRITIAAGLPIMREGGLSYVSTEGLVVPVDLDPATLGLSWTEPGLSAPRSPHAAVRHTSTPEFLALDGRAVRLERLRGDLVWPREVSELEGLAAEARWTFANRCVVVGLVGPSPGETRPMRLPNIRQGPVLGRRVPRWRAKTGTRATWPDGSEAGVTRRATSFEVELAVEGEDGRVCGPVSNELTLCLEREALEFVP